jgi:sporulation integral membrane protein YtvI
VNPDLERYSKTILKVLIVLACMITLFFAVAYFIPLFFDVLKLLLKGILPFLFALVLAILIDPFVDWLEQKKGIQRGLAVAFVLFLLVIFITLFMVFVISRLVIELSDLYQQIPLYTQTWYGYILNAIEEVRNYLSSNPLPQEAQDALRNSMNSLIDQTAGVIGKTTNFLFALLTGLPGFITILIVSALATFFISRDKVKISQFFYKLIPNRHIKPVSTVVGHINSALVGFFRAETILISITALLTITGLYLIGVDYALTVGIIVGLLDLLPILGPGAFFIPWAVIAFISGRISFGVALLIIYGIVSTVRQLIEPKILSQSIGLNPLATLIAIYAGLQFFGVAGIIIGPFAFILLKGILKGWNHDF